MHDVTTVNKLLKALHLQTPLQTFLALITKTRLCCTPHSHPTPSSASPNFPNSKLYHVQFVELVDLPVRHFQHPLPLSTLHLQRVTVSFFLSCITHACEKKAPTSPYDSLTPRVGFVLLLEGIVNKRKSPQFRLVSNIWVLHRRKQKPDTRKWISSCTAIQLLGSIEYHR